MSTHISSLLRDRNLGVGLTGKAVILLMADLASDDGTGIYPSKETMARELETTDRTIQRTIRMLLERGFVIENGKRPHRNGHTMEYSIDVTLVASMPESVPGRDAKRGRKTQHVDPSTQDVAGDTGSGATQGQGSTQYVGGATQDVAPDRVSGVTEGHQTGDRGSGEPPTESHPNLSLTKEERRGAPAEAAQASPPEGGGRPELGSSNPLVRDTAEQLLGAFRGGRATAFEGASPWVINHICEAGLITHDEAAALVEAKHITPEQAEQARQAKRFAA